MTYINSSDNAFSRINAFASNNDNDLIETSRLLGRYNEQVRAWVQAEMLRDTSSFLTT